MITLLTNRIKLSPALTFMVLNLAIGLGWAVSLLVAKFGFAYLAIPFGLAALAAPGFCLTLLFEQLSESRTKPIIFFFWVIMLTLTVTPAALVVISRATGQGFPVNAVFGPFLLWWALCFAAAALILAIQRRPTIFSSLRLTHQTKKELGLISLGFVAILVLNFVIYPLLPEADGYLYLTKWPAMQANPALLGGETRILFFIFVNTVSHVLKIDPYWVLKVLLPLGHITLALACYSFARKFTTDSRYRVLFALMPLAFPVILQELLISRPQSAFLISFLPSIVIVWDIVAEKQNIRQLYWLGLLAVIGGIGIQVHGLFTFIAFSAALSIIFFLRHEIVRRPFDAGAVLVIFLALIAPEVIRARLLYDIWHVITLFGEAFARGHFEWWFLDHYRNVDGIEVGWPGISGLFYYGYNLGLAFPLIFLYVLARKKSGAIWPWFRAAYWHIVFLVLFFFFIAEVAPRFGIAYLPDRAWLFLALLFSFGLPLALSGLVTAKASFLRPALVSLFIVSVLAGTALTYAKQGWVTPPEVKAATFLRDQTPANALFLGQGSTKVMIRYYGHRVFAHPAPAVFLDGGREALDDYLKTQAAPPQGNEETIERRKAELSMRLGQLSLAVNASGQSEYQLRDVFTSLRSMASREDDYFLPPPIDYEKHPIVDDRPIYLVYNLNKFKSLYGTRSWWRTSNFYGANIDRLNATYPVVYNKGGVIIWEARK